jgi:hypothetical protein
MSATVDKFCDNLRNGLNSVEKRLQAAKKNVQSLADEGEKTLRRKCDDLHWKAQAEKDRVERLQASLKTKALQKVAETKEVVSQWKAKNETRMLNARADLAEAYAADAIEFAVAAIDEAEGAILDAVVARIDSDEAK